MKKMTSLPTIFIGHGNPMNAIQPNQFFDNWGRLGTSLPKPTAIVCISAHWLTQGSFVTTSPLPQTIHDFYGFPPELYKIQYPAPGSPTLADKLISMVSTQKIHPDPNWGLDHGTWCILQAMYPEANIPVIQLSMDATLALSQHYQIARELASLREEGILFLGSGNIVHNLRLMQRSNVAVEVPWASRFDKQVMACLRDHNHQALLKPEQFGEDAKLAINSGEHYLPLIYCMGLAKETDEVCFFNDSMDLGTISMTSVIYKEPGLELPGFSYKN
ncbi:4,5-DOPA dioxygenase extradiol [Ampullimonas aquatilis]|uniref:4,5-DOPA-extradiol-dioxygenase n=1 Tax=Ampullimonas aquatilis TaxID=1341549 RepID=UPI003C760BCA